MTPFLNSHQGSSWVSSIPDQVPQLQVNYPVPTQSHPPGHLSPLSSSGWNSLLLEKQTGNSQSLISSPPIVTHLASFHKLPVQKMTREGRRSRNACSEPFLELSPHGLTFEAPSLMKRHSDPLWLTFPLFSLFCTEAGRPLPHADTNPQS